MLLHNQWFTEEIKEKIKKILGEKGKQNHNDAKSMGHSRSKKKVYSNTSLPQDRRKILHKHSNLTPKELEKEEKYPKLVDENKS